MVLGGASTKMAPPQGHRCAFPISGILSLEARMSSLKTLHIRQLLPIPRCLYKGRMVP